jgi:hypothetical protein
MRRLIRLSIAWGAGGTIYMVAVRLWGLDGLAALILQPLCAAVVSAARVGAVVLAGLVLHVRPVGRLWHPRPAWARLIAVACLGVMRFGSAVGLTGAYVDPETGQPFVALHPAAALSSYLGLLFALAHWPQRPVPIV